MCMGRGDSGDYVDQDAPLPFKYVTAIPTTILHLVVNFEAPNFSDELAMPQRDGQTDPFIIIRPESNV